MNFKYTWLAFCAILLLNSSCGKIFYGSSTDVLIETDKVRDTGVNIISVGPKKVFEYNNVSLPYNMKVKHNNFPLDVNITSPNYIYDPLTINSKTRGDWAYSVFGIPLTVVCFGGSILGIAGAIAGSDNLALAGCMATLGTLPLWGLTASISTEVPENKIYLTSSYPVNENNSFMIKDSWIRDSYISKAYKLIDEGSYDSERTAETLIDWLMEKEETGELYYLKGLIYLKNDYTKKARKYMEHALLMVDVEKNPGLHDCIAECLQEIEDIRRKKRENRADMWSNFALGVLQTTANTLSTYSQYKQNEQLYKNGITPSGVVTDPSKISQEMINNLANPMLAVQEVNQKEYMEYLEFSRYNKKADGSNYTMQEFQAFKGQALLNAKENGVDLVAEQRELNRIARNEFRESIERDRVDRLERMGVNVSERSTSINQNTSEEISNEDIRTQKKIVKRKVNDEELENEDIDSKEQNKNEPVSSDEYHRVKDVSLYYRDGNDARVMMNRVELSKKGAYYFIKIGNMYYPRRASNWNKFRNAISYGHVQLYYND